MRAIVGGLWLCGTALWLVTAGCAAAPPAAPGPEATPSTSAAAQPDPIASAPSTTPTPSTAPAPTPSVSAAAAGLEVLPDAAACQIWKVERLAGKTLPEAEALLGMPESIGPNGIFAEWYQASPKHVNPYMKVSVNGGKITQVQCGLR